MRRTILGLITMAFVLVSLADLSKTAWAKGTIDRQLAVDAVSESADVAQQAIKSLREYGPDGLAVLEEVHRAAIDQHKNSRDIASDDAAWQRIKAALDAVGGQRDCHTSQLYWYTDLEAAKAQANRLGKPILSLRLLGKLTDEFSCANSRFFRTTLYANEEVSKVLREEFVLHWQSVRPVPKVTIDFGDGRKLERTLTGNSVHYVLDSDGRPIDALPGLYGPKAFLRGIETARAAVFGVRGMSETDRASYLVDYHAAMEKSLRQQWKNDLADLGLLPSDYDHTTDTTTAKPSVLIAKTDDAVWGRIAQLHRADATLDEASIALIRSQHPTAAVAAPLTASKAMVENPLLRIVNSFQYTVAIDTVRNEYMMHRQIHEWLSNGGLPTDADVDTLNDRVYTQLFLTPSSDPWLGLISGDAYTALDNNGVTQSTVSQ